MHAPPMPLPDLDTLVVGLTAVLAGAGMASGRVTILERRPSRQTSTFPSELVTCRVGDRQELRLLCKNAPHDGFNHHGHRGGLAYEAAVYRHVLQPLQVSTPRYYGIYRDAATGMSWLVLEFLADGLRVSKAREPNAMELAARWLGAFHRANAERVADTRTAFLMRHDTAYYQELTPTVERLVESWSYRFPWLHTLHTHLPEFYERLSVAPLTIIHGEYYPKNVLIQDGTIYPVDWESTAIAVGEIDLASLTENWPMAAVETCESEYQRARWLDSPPAHFQRTLALARLYWPLRWLVYRPKKATEEYLESMYVTFRRTGLASEL